MTNKNFLLLLPLFLLLIAGCTDDDDGGFFNRIAQIGRSEGWKLGNVVSDYEAVVSTAIDNLTEEQITADSRSREELRQQYDLIVRTATVVDECDRDDVLFFLDNGDLRIIPGVVTCGADGDPSPLAIFDGRSYSVNTAATEMSIRANNGAFQGAYQLGEINDGSFIFEREATVPDSVFTDLTYNIRYELVPN